MSPEGRFASTDVVVTNTKSYLCYFIASVNTRRTYIGCTNNMARRFRQHQGELAGGAVYTRIGRPWHIMCLVRGFVDKRQTLQFEWAWKHVRPSGNRRCTCSHRFMQLALLLQQAKWTPKSPLAMSVPLRIEHVNAWNPPPGLAHHSYTCTLECAK